MAKEKLQGEGFLGWLGRQIGHVKKAVKTDVTKPAPKADAKKDVEKKEVIHREENIQEAELPDKPGVVLRRTVIDEVIVEKRSDDRVQGSAKPQTPRES